MGQVPPIKSLEVEGVEKAFEVEQYSGDTYGVDAYITTENDGYLLEESGGKIKLDQKINMNPDDNTTKYLKMRVEKVEDTSFNVESSKDLQFDVELVK